MNNLNRRIIEGEKVVLLAEFYKGSPEERTVTVHSGFGMSAVTSGTALYVTWPDGEKSRVEGDQVDAEATNALGSKA